MRRLSAYFQPLWRQPRLALYIALFYAVLWLPLADNLFQFAPRFKAAENRTLAEAPDAPRNAEQVQAYPAKFESYFNDHFGMRSLLIRAHHLLKYKGVGVSPVPRVVLAKDGWLETNSDFMGEYQHARPFSLEKLVEWQKFFEARRDWLAERGIKFLMIVAPNRASIYPEVLPASMKRLGDESIFDQFLAHMHQYSDVDILDVRPHLLEKKDEWPLYYKTDTHWTQYGAYIGYRDIMNRLHDWFPSVGPYPFDFFTVKQQEVKGKDIAIMMDLVDQFREPVYTLYPRTPKTANGPKQLDDFKLEIRPDIKPQVYESMNSKLRGFMFRDSFGVLLQSLLSEHFQRIVYYPRIYLDPMTVLKEHPDVVIHEMAERYFMEPLPEDPHIVEMAWDRIPPKRPAITYTYNEVLGQWDFSNRTTTIQAWHFPPKAQLASGGVVYPADKSHPGPGTNLELAAEKLDAVQAVIWLSALDNGQNVEPVYGLRLYWARDEDITPETEAWPFDDRRSVGFRRWHEDQPNRWTARLKEHPQWNGTIRKIFIAVVLPDKDPWKPGVVDPKAVCVKEIKFLR